MARLCKSLRLGVLTLLALSALKGAVSAAEIPDGCPCTDEKPPGVYTCEEQKKYGKCEREWMTANDYCAFTCGHCTCDNESNGMSDSSEMPINMDGASSMPDEVSGTKAEYELQIASDCQCIDVPPGDEFSCEEQKKMGKCDRPWMAGFCELTCGKCSCESSKEQTDESVSPVATGEPGAEDDSTTVLTESSEEVTDDTAKGEGNEEENQEEGESTPLSTEAGQGSENPEASIEQPAEDNTTSENGLSDGGSNSASTSDDAISEDDTDDEIETDNEDNENSGLSSEQTTNSTVADEDAGDSENEDEETTVMTEANEDSVEDEAEEDASDDDIDMDNEGADGSDVEDEDTSVMTATDDDGDEDEAEENDVTDDVGDDSDGEGADGSDVEDEDTTFMTGTDDDGDEDEAEENDVTNDVGEDSDVEGADGSDVEGEDTTVMTATDDDGDEVEAEESDNSDGVGDDNDDVDESADGSDVEDEDTTVMTATADEDDEDEAEEDDSSSNDVGDDNSDENTEAGGMGNSTTLDGIQMLPAEIQDVIMRIDRENAAESDSPTVPEPADCDTIWRAVEKVPELSSFKAALEKGNLYPAVSDPNLSVTMLAPNNKAFLEFKMSLGPDGGELLDDPEFLQALVSYHTILPPMKLEEMEEGQQLSTLAILMDVPESLTVSEVSGDEVAIEGDISSGTITEGNIQACGSVVHMIDTVLVSKKIEELTKTFGSEV